MRFRASLLLLAAPALLGQALEPRPKAADYATHASLPDLAIGAEYLVNSFSGRNQTFVAPDHLVIEVALYPANGKPLQLTTGQFGLRIKRKNRETLYPQSPGFVTAAMRYPDWEQRRRVEATAGVGDADIILGRPTPVERFPGDPMPSRRRLPPAPKAPDADHGVDSQPPARAEDVVVETALPEREISGPVSGYLYFPFKGKTKSIKSAELVYQGPAGSVTLKLF